MHEHDQLNTDARADALIATGATPRRAMLAGMAGIAAGALLTRNAKAGPLDPPAGPVTSTGKTLTEVEPRIAVNQTNTPGDSSSIFRITQPGSYYLTGNVAGESGKHGILVQASNVTLDLMGFALTGVSGSLDGIRMSSFLVNVVLRNGHVANWGQTGIRARIDSGAIEQIHAAGNGGWGINNEGGFSCRMTACTVRSNGGSVALTGGIRGGISTLVESCQSLSNTGIGIRTDRNSEVNGCVVQGNTNTGILINQGSLVQDCASENNGASGIFMTDDNVVRGNICRTNGLGSSGTAGAGVATEGEGNHIVENTCIINGRGIWALAGNNFIARNTCRLNTLNWSIAANNKCFVVLGANAPAISGDSGGTSPGSTNPNANYTY